MSDTTDSPEDTAALLRRAAEIAMDLSLPGAEEPDAEEVGALARAVLALVRRSAPLGVATLRNPTDQEAAAFAAALESRRGAAPTVVLDLAERSKYQATRRELHDDIVVMLTSSTWRSTGEKADRILDLVSNAKLPVPPEQEIGRDDLASALYDITGLRGEAWVDASDVSGEHEIADVLLSRYRITRRGGDRG